MPRQQYQGYLILRKNYNILEFFKTIFDFVIFPLEPFLRWFWSKMADHAWEMQRVSRMVRKVHNSCELMRNSSIWGTDHIYNLTLKVYVAENGTQDQDGLLCILYLTRATLISDRSSGRCCSFLSKGFSSLLLVAALNISTQCSDQFTAIFLKQKSTFHSSYAQMFQFPILLTASTPQCTQHHGTQS